MGQVLFQMLALLRGCCALQGAGMDKEGFDLVHLCSTFASDPFVMAFAKLIESGARLPCQRDLEIHPCLHAPSLGSARRLILRPSRALPVSE